MVRKVARRMKDVIMRSSNQLYAMDTSSVLLSALIGWCSCVINMAAETLTENIADEFKAIRRYRTLVWISQSDEAHLLALVTPRDRRHELRQMRVSVKF